jgi:hypothetical protein
MLFLLLLSLVLLMLMMLLLLLMVKVVVLEKHATVVGATVSKQKRNQYHDNLNLFITNNKFKY